MLTFVGLGLYDLDDISVKGVQAIAAADTVYLESYTSRLMGTTPAAMEERYGKPVQILKREDVEQHPEPILAQAVNGDVVFLTGGDPMVSTTHADIRIRAAEQSIPTRIIHGASIASAVSGLSGLQNYRFGKSCSVPYPAKNWFPRTPFETIRMNLAADLHTIVFLDIQENRYMQVREAVEILQQLSDEEGVAIPLYVGIARAGSSAPVVIAGNAEKMLQADFGPPLHILVVPAGLHPVEEEYLRIFADL
ncbi:MAG: diphthine synthase [Methanospirillum sp.]|uniref:diphthine synthase n=1 Tax=Methanospirillum sp. TaxID=45200 RepID=UPI002371A454|nr:diphthine synthase [Methanospirillum sp.]MDD1728543.1 diphthine synthase [Methanospirillum sp.]